MSSCQDSSKLSCLLWGHNKLMFLVISLYGLQVVEDGGTTGFNWFHLSQKSTEQVNIEFRDNCFAVDWIEYSIASVNEFFGMTKTYTRGFQMMWIRRWLINQATVVWLEWTSTPEILQIVWWTCVRVWQSVLGYSTSLIEHSFTCR